ncbi:hypothetical protein BRC86_10995 [Halobacteriales archaeon QS_3_64_16]|nr:MAG: hypothetical protein BRC86_10995 [Halobacteriales archaeon QS_3_64_16]
MSAIERLRETIAEHGRGLATDLVFAIVWVTFVEAFFALVEGPQWAYYLFMLAGVIAYFGFFASVEQATGEE